MGEMIDPVTGNVRGHAAGVPSLTGEQRRIAFVCDELANDLLPIIDGGKTWFTAYSIKQKPQFLDPLVSLGIFTKHKSQKHDGHYYKTTYLTRPFLLTALALRDERRRAMQERPADSQTS